MSVPGTNIHNGACQGLHHMLLINLRILFSGEDQRANPEFWDRAIVRQRLRAFSRLPPVFCQRVNVIHKLQVKAFALCIALCHDDNVGIVSDICHACLIVVKIEQAADRLAVVVV